MSPSDDPKPAPIDWRGWLSLAWFVGFGVLYALSILKEKAPAVYARFAGLL